MDIISELQLATDEVAKHRQLVTQEMNEKGSEGKLWQNGWCNAWPDYQAALEAQNKLRGKHNV